MQPLNHGEDYPWSIDEADVLASGDDRHRVDLERGYLIAIEFSRWFWGEGG